MTDWTKFKSRLIHAQDRDELSKVIKICNEFEAACKHNGYCPDFMLWHRFNVARQDAICKTRELNELSDRYRYTV